MVTHAAHLHQIAGQLHSQEHDAQVVGNKNTEGSTDQKNVAVPRLNVLSVGFVQNHHAQSTKTKHEPSREAFDDELTIESVLKEYHRFHCAVGLLVASNGGRLNDDVIDDAREDQIVRQKYESEHRHGTRHGNAGHLEAQVGHLEEVERQCQDIHGVLI